MRTVGHTTEVSLCDVNVRERGQALRPPVRMFAALTACLALTGIAFVSGAAAAVAPPSVVGPDVSGWQHPNRAAIDWAKVRAAENSFAIIKATEGSGYTNPFYATDATGARAAHLVVGAYAFARPALPISTASTQATYFAATIGNVRTIGTLPPILDLEMSGGLSSADLVTWAQLFLETVRAQTGRTPIVYSYPYFWSSTLAGTTAFGRYPLWLASPSATAPTPFAGWKVWTLWQYSSSASLPGVPGGAGDMSRFAGTAAQLTAFGNGVPATAWTVRAPAAPIAMYAAPGVRSAIVGWQPSDDGGQVPSRYTVTASPGGAVTSVAGISHAVRVTGLTPGLAYSFTVRATNTAGTSTASVASRPVVPGALPAAPGRPAVSSASGHVTLTWGAVNGATRYLVHRCTAPCIPGAAAIGTATAPSSTYTDRTVVDGTRYVYAISAANGWGCSANGATALASPVGPPSSPTSLAAKVTTNSATLSWLPPVGTGGSPVTAYVVTVDGAARVTLPATARAWTLAGLPAASGHLLSVAAGNALGTGQGAKIGVTTNATVSRLATPTAVALTLPRVVLSTRPIWFVVNVRRAAGNTTIAGVPVVIAFTPKAGAAPAPVRVVTDATGRAAAMFRPAVTGNVTATVAASARYAGSSARAVLNVRPVVSAVLSAIATPVDQSVVLAGATSSLFAGERVYRQGLINGAWHTWADQVVDHAGRFRFVITPTVATVNRYRVLILASPLHSDGTSVTRDLRVG